MKYILIGLEDHHLQEALQLVKPLVDLAANGPGGGMLVSGTAFALLPHVQRAAEAESPLSNGPTT